MSDICVNLEKTWNIEKYYGSEEELRFMKAKE